MQILVALKTFKLILKILRSKVFWVAFIIFVIWIASTFSAFGFFINYAVMSSVDEAKAQAEEKAESIKNLYEDALSEQIEDPDAILGTPVPDFSQRPTEQVVPGSSGGGANNSGGGDGSEYDSTKDYAESISGSSILHQVHNSIVSQVNKTNQPWFTYELAYGTNMKEANGFGGSWIQHIGSDKAGLMNPSFDINSWGAHKVTNFSDISRIYNNKTYVGPFQGSYKVFNSKSAYPSGWSIQNWVSFVDSSDGPDGNGDGKSDPFNYLDSLAAMAIHYQSKYDSIKNVYEVSSQADLSDMLMMQVAARYVGISANKGSTKRFGSHGSWPYYPHSEQLNPHIQLMRKAIEEAKSGGPHYTKLKNVVAQSKSINGTTYSNIINEFYKANGWNVKGNYHVEYVFSDGQKMVLEGQNVHYVFLVYWGGRIAQQEITRILSSGGQ